TVLAGDRDDQTQVRVDELLDGAVALLGEPLEFGARDARTHRRGVLHRRGGGEQVPGVQAGLDGLGQLDLARGIEQGSPADLGQVHPDAVTVLDVFHTLLNAAPGAQIPLSGTSWESSGGVD